MLTVVHMVRQYYPVNSDIATAWIILDSNGYISVSIKFQWDIYIVVITYYYSVVDSVSFGVGM